MGQHRNDDGAVGNGAPVWGCRHFSWGSLHNAGFTPLEKEGVG